MKRFLRGLLFGHIEEENRELKQRLDDLNEGLKNEIPSLLASLSQKIDSLPISQKDVAEIRFIVFRILSNIDQVIVADNEDLPIKRVNLRQVSQDIIELFGEHFHKDNPVILHFLIDPALPLSVNSNPRSILQLVKLLTEEGLELIDRGELTISFGMTQTEAKSGDVVELFVSITAVPSQKKEQPDLSKIESLRRIRLAGSICEKNGGAVKVSHVADGGVHIKAGFVATVDMPGSIPKKIPKYFGFYSTSKDIFCVLGRLGFFHGARPIPLNSPIEDLTLETIFVEGDAIRDKIPLLEKVDKKKFIVLLRQNQLEDKDIFYREGFSRFLGVPFSSQSFSDCMLGLDSAFKPIEESWESSEPLRVLVVDDLPSSRARIREIVKSLGHKVEEASDGIELVARISRNNSYDLIFCDMMMTHLDGPSAVSQIRELGCESLIVAVTAHDVDIDEIGGFDEVLKKPVAPEAIYLLLGLALERRDKVVMRSTRIIDLEDLKARSLGKPALMAEVLSSFIEMSKDYLSEIDKFSKSTDTSFLVHSLHALKGMLLEIGAITYADMVKEIELSVKGNNTIKEAEVQKIKLMIEEARKAAEGIIHTLKD